jgi:hypothetical protein
MADRPRTFEEVVAATDPEEIARLNRGEKYQDQAVRDPFQREVVVFEDRYGNGEWRVEYNDDDGGCYVTVFGGPEAEWRAREYYGALKTGQLRTVRAMMTPPTTVDAVGRG